MPSSASTSKRHRAPAAFGLVAHRPGAADLAAVHAFTVEPKQWRTRRLTVARRFVTPPGSALPRIREETALLNALFRVTRPEQSWSGAFTRPVDGVAVSGFGVRSVLNGQPRGPHNGADFAAGTGTPIHAPGAGVVAYAREFYYSGNTVILDHGLGLYSTMAHLSAFDVQEGARVERGALLGKVGATGRVTGPHLHWSVRLLGRPHRSRVAARRHRVADHRPRRRPERATVATSRRRAPGSSPWRGPACRASRPTPARLDASPAARSARGSS